MKTEFKVINGKWHYRIVGERRCPWIATCWPGTTDIKLVERALFAGI